MTPDFYDRFYASVRKSRVHSAFCRAVYGADFCQHGFADVAQVDLAIDVGEIAHGMHVADIGCGNGGIARYISRRCAARVLGIDNSAVAIATATERYRRSRGLQFQTGDINDLSLGGGGFDVLVLIDSIYFSSDYDRTLVSMKTALGRRGRILLFYSIGPALLQTEDFSRELLSPEGTPLAQSLERNGLAAKHYDLTDRDYQLARRRREYLETHRRTFERAGLGFIWENRMGDSKDILRFIEAGKHRRYLYRACPG